MPKFTYYISPLETPLSCGSAFWQKPLPLARPSSGKSSEIVVTHGDYFEAIRSFLEQDDGQLFTRAIAKHMQQAINSSDIREIRVYLEKHGEFYHPARIETDLLDRLIRLVLNVAVSVLGNDLIESEYNTLKRLSDDFAETYVPRVYAQGEVAGAQNRKFAMFLGEWFADYHEFHLSTQFSGEHRKVCVWDDKNGRKYLSRGQVATLYRQAARILTYYYNPTTFEHVFPWHHAAGDFVVRLKKEKVDLKLITVRGYVPLFRNPDDLVAADRRVEQILQALLIFFLKLSIWMQLDRIDGVGEIVWSDPGAVKSTLKGTLDGLAQKSLDPILPDALDACFISYLSLCSPEDLYSLSDSIVQTLPAAAPEIPIIKQHLAEHVDRLYQSIRDMTVNGQ